MFYLVYKISNKINGKFYIGCHKTPDKNDGYMGSGKLIKRAIAKHGVENFEKIILFEADSSEEMFAKERELVAICPESYNLKVGGDGGFDYINSDEASRVVKNQKARKITNETHADKISEWSRKGGIRVQELYGVSESFRSYARPKGTVTSEETKEKIRQKAKLRTGSKTSAFGCIWITDGIAVKRIKKDEIIPLGWRRGRK